MKVSLQEFHSFFDNTDEVSIGFSSFKVAEEVSLIGKPNSKIEYEIGVHPKTGTDWIADLNENSSKSCGGCPHHFLIQYRSFFQKNPRRHR